MTAIVVIYFICALLLTVYGINAHILNQLFKRRYPNGLLPQLLQRRSVNRISIHPE